MLNDFLKKRIKSYLNFLDRQNNILRSYKTIIRFKQKILIKIKILIYSELRKKTITQLKQKKILNVAFFVQNTSQWKYEYLFNILIKDPIFCPYIVAIPNFDKLTMEEDYKNVIKFFSKRKYKLVLGYDVHKRKCLNNLEIKADIIFYSQAREYPDKFSIEKFKKLLCFYVPYSIFSDNDPEYSYNKSFHNLLYKHYLPTKYHFETCKQFSFNKGSNAKVVGYTGCDVYMPKVIEKLKRPIVWKKKNNRKKNIIWAPHHTINSIEAFDNHSNFLELNNFMIQVAKDYKKEINLCFKPHPTLKEKLYNQKNWGQKMTDKYYNVWKNMSNTQLAEGEYKYLFYQSDALIHDCISFLGEYLFLKKPALYILKKNVSIETLLNEFGKEALKLHYLAFQEDHIIKFIELIIQNEKDKFYQEKDKFLKNVLYPSSDYFSCELIHEDLKKIKN